MLPRVIASRLRLRRWVLAFVRAASAVFVAIVTVTTVPAGAEAQRSLDLLRVRPALDAQGFLAVPGTAVPGHGRWDIGLATYYTKAPLSVRTADGRSPDVIAHRLDADLYAQVGIWRRFSLSLELPLVLHQSTATAALADDGPAIASQAFGDPRITARARVFGEDPPDDPRGRYEGPGVAILARTTVPLGDEEAFVGEGQATLDLQVLTDFHLLGAGAGLMLGWRMRPHDRVVGDVTFRDELHFGIGLALPLGHPAMLGLVEVRGALDARDPFGGGARRAIGGDLGFRVRHEDVTITALLGTGFTNGVGTAQVRAGVQIGWAPRVRDSDGDGIPDDQDQCIHLPEDRDGFEDDDGCMDPDDDGDWIPDTEDRCPREPADPDRDADEDGCTDPE